MGAHFARDPGPSAGHVAIDALLCTSADHFLGTSSWGSPASAHTLRSMVLSKHGLMSDFSRISSDMFLSAQHWGCFFSNSKAGKTLVNHPFGNGFISRSFGDLIWGIVYYSYFYFAHIHQS